MKQRFKHLQVRSKSFRNRIVVPPMASQTALNSGMASTKSFEHYQRLSLAKPALLIVEYSYVHSSGKSESNQMAIDQDEQIEGLKSISNLIKASGALSGIQITHSGSKSNSQIAGGRTLAPSEIAVPIKGEVLETPKAMNLFEIEQMKSWFLLAADRAVKAGFDLVEIHSAHGYGLNQWLSPITNHRQDCYGKNLAGRSLLLLEIVRSIRKAHPSLLLSVRMPGQDFLEGGLQIDDSIQIAQFLKDAGVDILHISSGIGGWRRPNDRVGEGYLVDEAKAIASHVALPVIGVGGIQTANYIDDALEKKFFSFAAIGRAILNDPFGWQNLQMSQ